MRQLKFRAWDSERKKYFTSPKWVEFSINIKGELSAKNIDRKGKYQELLVCQYTGLKDKNGTEIYEGNVIGYYTTFHRFESASELFGVDPQNDFDVGAEYHRKYLGVIKFYPSVGFVLTNVRIYECSSEGEHAYEIAINDWDYIGKRSIKNMSCTRERCEVIGNIHENPELLEGDNGTF